MMMRIRQGKRGQRSLMTHAAFLLVGGSLATNVVGGGCSPQHCGLIDCVDVVTAELSTPLSADHSYLVRISTPEGEYEQTVAPGAFYDPFQDIISLEVEDGLIRAVQLNGHTPPSIVVQIERDGQVVFDGASDRIAYGHFYPNGADCDSGCRVARIEL